MNREIKEKLEELKKTNDKEIIKMKIIELYSILLGYYSGIRDKKNINLNNDTIIKDIDDRLKELTNSNYSYIDGVSFSIKDNLFSNINYLVLDDNKNIKTLSIILMSFLYGYDYVDCINLTYKKQKYNKKMLELKRVLDFYK